MLMPPISRYMTKQPWTIGRDAKLTEAHELMRQHAIRHLPVLEAGKLVGILSERDVYLFERFLHLDAAIAVEDAMTEDVYAVSCEESLDAVVAGMAERKLGSAVVTNRGGIIEGIFTTVDGMQVLADVLRRATA